MNVGDYVVETWRDADKQKRMKPLTIPVWRFVGYSGSAARLESLGGLVGVLTSTVDLRPATDDEVAAAKAAA